MYLLLFFYSLYEWECYDNHKVPYRGQPATPVARSGHENEYHKVFRSVPMSAIIAKKIKSHAYQLFDILVD